MIFLAISVAILLGALAGFFLAVQRRNRERGAARVSEAPAAPATAASPPSAAVPSPQPAVIDDGTGREKARLIRSLEAETWMLRDELSAGGAACAAFEETRREREQLFVALADAREATARYRQLVVDIENRAPPPILLGAAEPDDLKLIVGIGPVLERMLHHLGVGSFRQIARWSERDIAEFDAKLPEFPGRIARDQWVTQARALHESKYGERP